MGLAPPTFRASRQNGVHIFASEPSGRRPFRDRHARVDEGIANVLAANDHDLGPTRRDSLHYEHMSSKSKETRPFGQNLRAERLRLGLTQAQLATVGGVSKATQVAYEGGSTSPDARYLSRVAERGVDVVWLLIGRRAMPGVQWELLFEIRDLIDEWADDRGKETPQAVRDGLLRTLYAQFISDRQIDAEQLAATFRLVG